MAQSIVRERDLIRYLKLRHKLQNLILCESKYFIITPDTLKKRLYQLNKNSKNGVIYSTVWL